MAACHVRCVGDVVGDECLLYLWIEVAHAHIVQFRALYEELGTRTSIHNLLAASPMTQE